MGRGATPPVVRTRNALKASVNLTMKLQKREIITLVTLSGLFLSSLIGAGMGVWADLNQDVASAPPAVDAQINQVNPVQSAASTHTAASTEQGPSDEQTDERSQTKPADPADAKEQGNGPQFSAQPTVKSPLIWEDRNKDGLHGSDEPGLAQVTVQVLDELGNLMLTGQTDARGLLDVTGLAAGHYQLQISRPEGYRVHPTSTQFLSEDGSYIFASLTIGDEAVAPELALVPLQGRLEVRYVDETGKELRPPVTLLDNAPVGTPYDTVASRLQQFEEGGKRYVLKGVAALSETGQLAVDDNGQLFLVEHRPEEAGRLTEGLIQVTYVYRNDKDEAKKQETNVPPRQSRVTVSDGTVELAMANPYVQAWSGETAYDHDVFKKRYGITAEQLDGLIATLGEPGLTRVTGEKLLHWQQLSGLDVRVIMAFAMEDSSLGFVEEGQDLATPKLWLHGSDKPEATDEEHVLALAAFLREEKNTSIKAMDTKYQAYMKDVKETEKKAKKSTKSQPSTNTKPHYNEEKDGSLYFENQSASVRTRFLEDVNRWIDENGGTPEPPAVAPTVRLAVQDLLTTLPAGYQLTTKIDSANYLTLSYPWGQCTWYVYNRARELGKTFDPYMGDGGFWAFKEGFEVTNVPEVGAAVTFSPDELLSHPVHGHVAIVEAVLEDGSILISESNVQGLGVVSYRVFDAATAKQLTYVLGY